MFRLFKRLIILAVLVFLLIYLGSILLVALGGAYWQQQYNKYQPITNSVKNSTP